MTSSLINIGLVGLGGIAKKHISAIQSVPGMRLYAICDINKEKLDSALSQGNYRLYTSYEDLLADTDIDVIALCTPSGTHANLVIQAAKAKKHIVCEKPMALTVDSADEMIKACNLHKVNFFVVKQNRFNPPIEHLKKALIQERFGKLYEANFTVFWNRSNEYYKSTPWRGTLSMDGGMLLNQAAHHLDMLIWLFSMPQKVFAYTATLKHPIESEDTAVCVMKFESGLLAVFQATTTIFRKNYEGSLFIAGENGTVKIGGQCLNELVSWDFDESENEFHTIKSIADKFSNEFAAGHTKVYENVLKVLQSDEKIAVDGLEAKKTIQLAEALYRSAREAREVELLITNY